MALTSQDTAGIAELARLQLDDATRARFSAELSTILAFFQQLASVNTDGVEPLAHCHELTNVLREDAPTPSLPVDAAFANAPGRQANFFTVPPVLE